MIEKIEGNYPKTELDIKRFRIPGLKINAECPNCKEMIEQDIGFKDYFDYTEIKQPTERHFYCHKCEHEWDEKIILKVGVETLLEEDPEIQKLVKEAFFQ